VYYRAESGDTGKGAHRLSEGSGDDGGGMQGVGI